MQQFTRLVALHEAQQMPEESVKTFAAQVQGIAANCELEKKCTCGLKVNCAEETVYHIVLAGLKDRDLQAHCTSQALLKHIKDINTLVAGEQCFIGFRVSCDSLNIQY